MPARRLLIPRCSCRWNFGANADEVKRGLLRGRCHGKVCRQPLICISRVKTRNDDFAAASKTSTRSMTTTIALAAALRSAKELLSSSAELPRGQKLCTRVYIVLRRQRSDYNPHATQIARFIAARNTRPLRACNLPPPLRELVPHEGNERWHVRFQDVDVRSRG